MEATLPSKTLPSERLVFFSDAVFAIAMTLLALDLKPAEMDAEVTRAAFDHALASRLPGFVALVISFVVLASMWVTHHARFAVIQRVDATMIRIDLVLLFLVALMPLPTSILFGPTANSPWPVALYAATVGGGYLMLNLLWRQAHRAGFAEVSDREYSRTQWVTSPVWMVFLASIPLAFISPRVGMVSWVAIAVIQPLMTRWSARRFGPPDEPTSA